MDNIGGYFNPLRLLQRIPHGVSIQGLRDRLVHIIADFRTQTSLREGCNNILHTDCLLLAQVTCNVPIPSIIYQAACCPLSADGRTLARTSLLFRRTDEASSLNLAWSHKTTTTDPYLALTCTL